jgi:tetratricopeptide (TPR) repeat protein
MERTFGPEHTNAAIILKELAEICDLLEDYQEAETFYRRTLSIRERAARADDPFCIDILRGLAEVYRKQGKHRLAEPLRRRVLAHSERALGLEQSEGTRTRESREHSGKAKCKYRRAQCTGG